MAAAAQVGGQALSLATHSGLAAVNADAAIIAGYMGMSIPLIAYGLVSGGQMALTQMASQVAGVAQGSAMQAGARVATGSAGLGNIGAYNTGMFQSEAMPATAEVEKNGGDLAELTAQYYKEGLRNEADKIQEFSGERSSREKSERGIFESREEPHITTRGQHRHGRNKIR